MTWRVTDPGEGQVQRLNDITGWEVGYHGDGSNMSKSTLRRSQRPDVTSRQSHALRLSQRTNLLSIRCGEILNHVNLWLYPFFLSQTLSIPLQPLYARLPAGSCLASFPHPTFQPHTSSTGKGVCSSFIVCSSPLHHPP